MPMPPHSRIVPIAVAAVSLAAVEPPPPLPAAPDVEWIIQEAKRVQFSDMAAWTRFRFRRHVQQERLDGAGQVLETHRLEFEITPVGDGFDERLIQIDGRPPTAREEIQHRRQASFGRRYRAARAGGGSGGEEGGYTLESLLRLSHYTYGGLEEVGGAMCHRLDFEPEDGERGRGIEARLAASMAGSLWITADGYHLARAAARTVRPVSIALSIAKVYELELHMESVPVAGGFWLPGEIVVRADARVSWVPVRKRTVYRYSDFHPLSGTPSGEPRSTDPLPAAAFSDL
jgi:hypothetical protein